MYMYVYTHTYVHTYVRTCTYVRTYVRTYIYLYVGRLRGGHAAAAVGARGTGRAGLAAAFPRGPRR